MLVLSRHRDETIIIGDDIELTVVDIRGDKVRLGIKAPPHIAVHRKEVYEAIRRENERAASLQEQHIAPGFSVSPRLPGRTAKQPPSNAVRVTDQNTQQAKRESA
jgi:carbon storage regulator